MHELTVLQRNVPAALSDFLRMAQTAETLVVTADDLQGAKKVRADLNKAFNALDECRKSYKREILAQYDAFEAEYMDQIAKPHRRGDENLARQIRQIEEDERCAFEERLRKWFEEYADSIGIPTEAASWESAQIKVTRSASENKLRDACKIWLDRVAADLRAIDSMNNREAVLVEYYRVHSLPAAVATVNARAAAEEAARKRRGEDKQEVIRKARETLLVNIAEQSAAQEEAKGCAAMILRVRGRKDALMEALMHLESANIDYEIISKEG